MKRVSINIVIPVFNERDSLISVVNQTEEIMRSIGYDYKIIVVDDGSTDKYRHIFEELSLKNNIEVIRHQCRKGYGRALKTGFEFSNSDFLAFVDADGTYSPAEFPRLIRPLIEQKEILMCSGSRLSRENNKQMSFIRKFGNNFYTALISFLLNHKVNDACSGMRVFKWELLDLIDYRFLSDDLDFSVQLTTRCLRKKIRISEIPINYNKREGYSKISFLKHGFKFTASILKEWRACSELSNKDNGRNEVC